MKENNQEILDKLAETLNKCRITNNDEIWFNYVEESEVVVIYKRGSNEDEMIGQVNVACDSGIAMTRDILRHPYFN